MIGDGRCGKRCEAGRGNDGCEGLGVLYSGSGNRHVGYSRWGLRGGRSRSFRGWEKSG
jgi:hypothetical protein